MATLSDIGAALVAGRRAAGITQAELGAQVGASQQQIARWESHGYQNVDLARVSEVAEALGFGADDVIAGGSIAAEPRVAYRPGRRAPGRQETPRGHRPDMRSLLWDVSEADLDEEAHARFLIRRVLEAGRPEHVAWMFRRYPLETIRDVAASDGALPRRVSRAWIELLGRRDGRVA